MLKFARKTGHRGKMGEIGVKKMSQGRQEPED